jgi:hypothetical protein
MRRGLGDDLRAVLPPYLVARVLVALAWAVAAAAADHHGVEPAAQADGLLAWDGTWYRDIAEVGYGGLPAAGLRFFPFYPLVGRVGGVLLAGHDSWALVVVANLAALGLAVVVRRLVLLEKGDVVVADRAVWVMTLFPSAFVLTWAYSESVMLLATVGAFLAARRRRWWWAAACGAVAGLSRPLGLALALALLVEAGRGWWFDRGDPPALRPPAREVVGRAAAVLAPGVATVAYLAWVQSAFGNWRLPLTVQDDLRGGLVNPLVRLWDGLRDVVGAERFGDGLHIPFAIGFVVLLVLCVRRWPASYTVYAAGVMVVALEATNFNSIERYGLNAFPLLLTLALLLDTRRKERIGLAVCACGLLSLCALAWLGVYVP